MFAARPIADVSVVLRDQDEAVPNGWDVLECTVSGENSGNCNQGSKGRKMFLAYRRCESADDVPITDLGVHYASTPEAVPPRYTVVRKSVTGQYSADLNLGTGAGQIYLVTRKSRYEHPVTSIGVIVARGNVRINAKFLPPRASDHVAGDLAAQLSFS